MNKHIKTIIFVSALSLLGSACVSEQDTQAEDLLEKVEELKENSENSDIEEGVIVEDNSDVDNQRDGFELTPAGTELKFGQSALVSDDKSSVDEEEYQLEINVQSVVEKPVPLLEDKSINKDDFKYYEIEYQVTNRDDETIEAYRRMKLEGTTQVPGFDTIEVFEGDSDCIEFPTKEIKPGSSYMGCDAFMIPKDQEPLVYFQGDADKPTFKNPITWS